MKNHKKTDRIIKNKMEKYSMDAPMHLFDGIADALDGHDADIEPAKKSRGRNYWILGLLILTLAGGGIWWSVSDSNKSALTDLGSSEVSSTATSTSIAKSEIISKGNQNINEASFVSNNKNQTSSTSTVSKIENTVSTSTDINSDYLKNNSASISTEEISNQEVETTNSIIVSQSINIEKTTFDNIGNIINASSRSTSSKVDLTEKGGVTNSSESNSEVISNIQNSKPIADNTNSENLILGKNETIEKINLVANQSNSRFSKEAKEKFYLPKLEIVPSKLSTPPFTNSQIELGDPVCGINPDGSKLRFTTSVDAIFSLDYAAQILEYKSDDFKDYAQRRTDTESPYYSFQTGVRVNFLTEHDWALRTGIIYTQIDEILKTEQNETVVITDPMTGDTTDFSSGTRIVNRLNKYKMWDIPVLVGYEMQMKRFRLNVNGGVFVNLKSEQIGAINSLTEERVVYFTEGHPDDYDFFRDRIGFSTYLSLGFNFDIGDKLGLKKKLQLIVEPNIRYYPKSFAVKDYILNQKYLTTGLMVGLRKDL